MTRKYLPFYLLLGLILSSGCGSDESGSLQGVVRGQSFEVSVQDVRCDASPPIGPGLPGLDGALSTPLFCSVAFRTDGFFSDFFAVSVSDVRVINDFLGQWLQMDGALVSGVITVQGQEQSIIQGFIRFTDVSNVSGQRVAAQYQILTGDSQLEGSFKTNVVTGF